MEAMGKKRWDASDLPTPTFAGSDSRIRGSSSVPASSVNSIWLQEALAEAIAAAGNLEGYRTPRRLRCWRAFDANQNGAKGGRGDRGLEVCASTPLLCPWVRNGCANGSFKVLIPQNRAYMARSPWLRAGTGTLTSGATAAIGPGVTELEAGHTLPAGKRLRRPPTGTIASMGCCAWPEWELADQAVVSRQFACFVPAGLAIAGLDGRTRNRCVCGIGASSPVA